MKPNRNNVMKMLNESNAIEGVYDNESLIQARLAWEYVNRFDTLNNMLVKQTHKILMEKMLDIEHKYKGDFRDVPVMIGGKVKAQPKIVIDSLMRDWCTRVNNEVKSKKSDHILAHIKFEDIHPFIDGNGRMGRILMNWQAVRTTGKLQVFTEANKQDYYKLFRANDMLNDLLWMNARDL